MLVRLLLSALYWLPAPALFVAALVAHPEDAVDMFAELLWGAVAVTLFMTGLAVLVWLWTVIADRVKPRPARRIDVEPVSHLSLRLLAAEAVMTAVLVNVWLLDGHIELAWWCGMLLGIWGSFSALLFLGELKRVELDSEGEERPK